MHEEAEMAGDSAMTLIRMEGAIDVVPGDESGGSASSSAETIQDDKRGGWDNKVQYILAQIGFAVGLGNVWRFPYLCQKNGGGAFLIPYFIMLIIEGIPLFYLEIAIGQRKRRGSVGVWNLIHPYLGGVGIASMVVCCLIAIYYNMIIAWAFFYFYNSFTTKLPWAKCPDTVPIINGTDQTECELVGSTSYFWYKTTLDVVPSIDAAGGNEIVWPMVVSLLIAWIVIFFGTFKGIQSSGKMVYFASTFPYIVLIIFFFRGITLDGAVDGLAHMFTPRIEKLWEASTWKDAATQIFFSLGLGFGGVIAYSSYNDVKNNCRKDALFVSVVNCATSVFACVVIFSILGFKAHHNSSACIERDLPKLEQIIKDSPFSSDFQNVTKDNYVESWEKFNTTIFERGNDEAIQSWNNTLTSCSIKLELEDAVQGSGLAFIAFTEAMIHMPAGPIFSILFFAMLINLGLGSMFGTMEGIITPLRDLGLTIRKEIVVAFLCTASFGIGLLFTQRSGKYYLEIFDGYAGTVPLLLIAFFETVAVVWIYGFDKFSEDLSYMIGDDGPGKYWEYTWKYISPVCMITLFFVSIYDVLKKAPQYEVYEPTDKGINHEVNYPTWSVFLIVALISLSIVWIPIISLLRKFKITSYVPVQAQPKQSNQRVENEYLSNL